jgi:hypothetical protein
MRVIKMAKRCKCAKLRASTVSSTIITESLPTIKPQSTSDLSLSSVMTASDKPSAASSKIKVDVEKQHPEGRS